MQTGTGRRRMLPRSRRLVCDLLHFARQVPLFPLERSCDLMDGAERSVVTILFDHRVTDDACIARALRDMEALLKGPIIRELEDMAGPRCRQSLAS